MMFIDFAAAHGLDIRRLEHGRIARCPTKEHARKQNGAYLFEGEWGWVQDWSTMLEPEYWKDDSVIEPNQIAALHKRMEESRKQHAQERTRMNAEAAKRAQAIIDSSKTEPHAYLDSKGWSEEGIVYYPSEKVNLLVIPMRIGGVLVGCQLIDRDGKKKFLKGQRTIGAEYIFGNRGVFGARGADIWCEGYATGRSISECLSMAGLPTRVHACFSAGNMQRMASHGFVVADNDASHTGEKAAQATGLPYWMPSTIGTDFNDHHVAVGTFAAGMELRRWLQKARTGSLQQTALRA